MSSEWRYPTWKEIMDHSDNPVGALLIQAVAIISTQLPFTTFTPEEVYDHLVKHTKEVREQTQFMDKSLGEPHEHGR